MVVICEKKYENNEYDKYFERYDFPLSDFQKYAIEAIINENDVLITAHTGSGKTLPAEFAICHFFEKGKKVVYTTPIKALSNQKYYEFTNKYPNISFGLFTGDIKTNPNADVLIMTTEILMNYLFNIKISKINEKIQEISPKIEFQIDIENELGCVVFDEIHYINDEVRGKNWEQTILMLPEKIQMLMLSATIDKPEHFAIWCEKRISKLGKQVYLCPTNKRVVPLTHYYYMTTNESIFKKIKDKKIQEEIRNSTNKLIQLKDENGQFQEKGYLETKKIINYIEKYEIKLSKKHILNNLSKFLKEKEMLPAICFVFSRKNVEIYAEEITTNLLEDDSKIPYIISREAENILRKLSNYEEYLRLPEYIFLIKLLEKGIGIHHSGMIPILREMVELFISKKYIKLLFATETFSIGLDCPIKTTIFSSIYKFDGNVQRQLYSHEYTQMAGRAGRRGIDKIGNVVHCNNMFHFPIMNDYKSMTSGFPQKMKSKFNVSYSLILKRLETSTIDKTNDTKIEIIENEKNIKNIVEKTLLFFEKSMLFDEINSMILQQKEKIEEFEKKLELKKSSLSFLKTPIDICEKYLELEKMILITSNKKRKIIEREKMDLIDNYKFCINDVKIIDDVNKFASEIEREKENFKNMENDIHNQIEKQCLILEKNGFIHNGILTELGIIAKNINEIHPLIIASFIQKMNYMENLNEIQIISLYSCFIDIKIKDEFVLSNPILLNTNDDILKHKICELFEMSEYYEKMENDLGLYMKKNDGERLNINLVIEIQKWCLCNSEIECKYFIENVLFGKNISLGDFIKAILKISAINKEIKNIFENMIINKTDFLYKISKIDNLIMKYVAINQSLYL